MIDFSISADAAAKLAQVLNKDGGGKMLRVSIRGGGCAGFEYQFDTTNEAEEGDYRFERDGIEVLVDPVSGAYLNGATLDYVVESFAAKFVLDNPGAQVVCGCGKSFSGG